MKSLQELINKHGDHEIEESKFKELFGIKTEWKPEKHEGYWYVTNNGETFETVWTDSLIDQGRWEMGNVYQTGAEAQFASDKKRFLVKMERDFEDNSEPIDWKNEKQHKYCIEYNHLASLLQIAGWWYIQPPTLVTTNKRWLEQYIKDNEADIKKYLFGIKS